MKKIVICNCCGKEIEINNEVPSEEYLYIQKQWGYFSKKDGHRQEMNVCESCFDTWTGGFRIPVMTTEVTELL